MKKGFLKINAPLIVTLCVCICTVSSIYLNALNAEFVFDDKTAISDNYDIRMKNINIDSILTSMNGNRPIATFSFAMNYYLHGYSVQGYHVVNIIIHIMNSILIFFLINKMLIITGYKDRWELRWIPVLTACLWAVNPVHVQSVTYVVQRMTSMATMFYIASLLSYLIARTSAKKRTRNSFFIFSILSGLSSVLSKEIAVTLPCFILLFEWVFFRNADTRLLKKNIFPITTLFLLVAAIAFFIFKPIYSDFIASGYSDYNFDMIQRCLSQFRVVLYYIGLLFFPHPSRLNIDYDFQVSYSIIDPLTTLIAAVVVVTLIGGSFYLIFASQKNNQPINKLVAFSILWYFGNLFIESSFIPLDMVFEHRTYLPSILLFFMSLLLLAHVLKNRMVLLLITICCMIFCSYWTINRNKDWRTEKKIWLDASCKSPEKARPYYNVGVCYEENKEFKAAYDYYLKAIDKDPGYQRAYINIGFYYLRLGEYNHSLEYFTKAFELKPDEIEASAGIGTVLVKLKRYNEAINILQGVLKRWPNHIKANIYIGEAYLGKNMFIKALKHYAVALKLKPEKKGIYYNLGILYNKMKKTDLAIENLNRSISLDSNFVLPYILLGRIYASLGSYEKGISYFEQAVRIDASSTHCHEHWALLLLKKGDIEGAIYHFKRIIEIEPENFMAMNNLAVCYMKGGMFSNAADVYIKMVQIQPDNNIVLYNLACAYSASGELEKSIETLKTTIDKGFADIEDMKNDPDLSMLMESGIGLRFLGELDSI